MDTNSASRRNFLKILGLSAGATIASTGALANVIAHREILKLNPEQQEFMLRYGKWMDEFIEVIAIQKTSPDDLENNKKMMVLTEQAQQWQPKLNEYMKDEKFALIYRGSIERMRNEI